MKTRTLLKRLVVAAVVSLFVAAEAAALTIFTGEDLATGGTVPPGGNAASARQDFVDALTGGISVVDFDGPTTVPNTALAPIGGTLTGSGSTIDSTEVLNFGMFPTSGNK